MLGSIAIADEYTDSLETELRDYFGTLTSASNFEECIWFFNLLKRSAGHKDSVYKIYFASIPDMYLDLVRYWVLLRLRKGGAIQTQCGGVSSLAHFLRFLVDEAGAPDLFDVNPMVIEAYEDNLRERKDLSRSSKEVLWTAVNNLFRDLQTWPQMPKSMPVAPGNPFNRTELDRKHSQRLVPEMVLEQLDAVYRDDRIPLEDRLCYWLFRSIPSRVSELCSIKLDCLRPYEYNGRQGFIITIPEWKQSGNQHRPRNKLVHLLNEGHGKFIIDLVRKQQECARGLQDKLQESSKGYLMVSPHFRYTGVILRGLKREIGSKQKRPFILTGPCVRIRMKEITEHLRIVGPDGEPYDAITHCFRHNGITERLYEGFTYVEIRDMTGHHGNQMLTSSYVHVSDKKIKALASERREKGETGPPVLFMGRIMNISAEKEMQLLKNPRAYRIGNLGICSDLTSCAGDLFECLDCNYFVPDADSEAYYVAECKKWGERVAKHLANGNRSLAEHASHMANLHEKQLERIRLSCLMLSGETSDG